MTILLIQQKNSLVITLNFKSVTILTNPPLHPNPHSSD
jgi:hypothetical protein